MSGKGSLTSSTAMTPLRPAGASRPTHRRCPGTQTTPNLVGLLTISLPISGTIAPTTHSQIRSFSGISIGIRISLKKSGVLSLETLSQYCPPNSEGSDGFWENTRLTALDCAFYAAVSDSQESYPRHGTSIAQQARLSVSQTVRFHKVVPSPEPFDRRDHEERLRPRTQAETALEVVRGAGEIGLSTDLRNMTKRASSREWDQSKGARIR
jgi:hypothetical protein